MFEVCSKRTPSTISIFQKMLLNSYNNISWDIKGQPLKILDHCCELSHMNRVKHSMTKSAPRRDLTRWDLRLNPPTSSEQMQSIVRFNLKAKLVFHFYACSRTMPPACFQNNTHNQEINVEKWIPKHCTFLLWRTNIFKDSAYTTKWMNTSKERGPT